jgi:AcrR family transcriptional regulator
VAPRTATRVVRGAATVNRLLDAAAGILVAQGAAALSVQGVADAAGASKGLVHYHFADKDALLAACVQRLTLRLVAAERLALSASTAQTALDDLWTGLVGAEPWAWRRALVALAADGAPATRAAFAESLAARRAAAIETLARLESLFEFRPSIPRATLAAAFTAFADGLAMDVTVTRASHHRKAFDAFWLAVLSLSS